jgi:carboxypeptidase Q
MVKRLAGGVAIAVAFFVPTHARQTTAPSPPADTIVTKIRQEGQQRSQIMRTLHFLTDVYGPRLTGSPSLKAAGEWSIRTMASWGLTHGHLEPWDFGRPGWVNERLSAHIVAPVKDPLTAEVLAWTPPTDGVITAQAFHMVLPERPTQADLTNYFDRVRNDVRGRIVLAGRAVTVPVNLTPPALRRDDAQVRAQYAPEAAGDPGQFGGAPRPDNIRPAAAPPPMPPGQVDQQVTDFLIANGARVRINDAGRELGQITPFQNRTYDVAKALPTIVLRNEDYGRIARILADGTPVELEIAIVNRLYPEGKTAYNAIAEIPGTDRKEEVVMLGGHLDSWHAATGATDNAIGCAIMMEAARILEAIGAAPRRTIRVALWSGEEQGLLGSRAYVKEHFGTVEKPQADFGRLAAYLNIDGGTGRARGATVFGPAGAVAVLRSALKPFEDLGVFGAAATRNRNLGGTDSTAFNNAGLPGVLIGQDPIEYNSATHHTNLDTYERVLEDDAKNSAVAIAALAYDLAMRDEMLPRFSGAEMPAAPRQ